MKIQFAGHEFILHHSGVMHWPDEDILVVSDLHLEKGSHHARRGFFLPPYDSLATLQNLHKAIADIKPARIVLLGDSFHDGQGHARLSYEAQGLLSALTQWNPVWITGNHDGDYVPDGFIGEYEWAVKDLFFRHEASGENEISGHYHPKVDVHHKRARISRRCFVEDGTRLIMPSFGAYTGGMNITDPVLRPRLGDKYRFYPLGDARVFAFDNTVTHR